MDSFHGRQSPSYGSNQLHSVLSSSIFDRLVSQVCLESQTEMEAKSQGIMASVIEWNLDKN